MAYKYHRVGEFFHPCSFIDRVPRNEKPAAYCYCPKHKGFLTKGMIKSHKCYKKKCRWLKEYN